MEDSFLALTESGEEMRVLVIRGRTDVDGEASMPGLSQLFLEDGRLVQALTDGTYVVVTTGERIFRKP
jgi:hypothetical protein